LASRGVPGKGRELEEDEGKERGRGWALRIFDTWLRMVAVDKQRYFHRVCETKSELFRKGPVTPGPITIDPRSKYFAQHGESVANYGVFFAPIPRLTKNARQNVGISST